MNRINLFCFKTAIVIFVISLTSYCFATTYYVSPTGDDTINNGTSELTPWKTLDKINTYGNSPGFNPGDIIKFEGGKTFEVSTPVFGSSLFIPRSGESGSPIIYTSYGGSRATIKTDAIGIFCASREYIEIRSLNIRSNYDPFNQGSTSMFDNIGIYFLMTKFRTNVNASMHGIVIDSCGISRFVNTAISFIYSDSDRTHSGGYEDILISNSRIDSIGHFGIQFRWFRNTLYSFANYPHNDIIIRNCTISRIPGFYSCDIGPYTGVGILLIDVDTALVERNTVFSCGGVGCTEKEEFGGADGIELSQCQRVIFQYNEVYDQGTAVTSDGSGMHFGDGVQNSIMQYNYTHDNEGPGLNLVCGGTGYPLENRDNTIRYNICAKNGKAGGHTAGEIQVGGHDPKITQNIKIYNNTLYSVKYDGYSESVLMLFRRLDSIFFHNNILICADTTVALISHHPVGGNYTNIFIQGNVYWSTSQRFKFRDDHSYYYTYTDWQTAFGHEKIGGVNVGFTEDPKLVNPGNGGNINDAYLLHTMTAYKTQPGSIIVENGLDLTVSPFNLDPGDVDFYGTAIPNASEYDIGSYEDTSRYVTVDLRVLYQGFYSQTTDKQIGDTCILYLASSGSPYAFLSSHKKYVDTSGFATLIFDTSLLPEDGDLYLVVTHRNSIQTWSKLPMELNLPSSRVSYDFTTDSTKAYGDNLKRKGNRFCIYSGDVNQDEFVDATDVTLVYNDYINYIEGYVATDLNGDQFVDVWDYQIVTANNSSVEVIKP